MEPDELTLKFIGKGQGPRMVLNKNKVEWAAGWGITHQIVYYTAIDAEAVAHGTRSENKPTDQNRTLPTELGPSPCDDQRGQELKKPDIREENDIRPLPHTA